MQLSYGWFYQKVRYCLFNLSATVPSLAHYSHHRVSFHLSVSSGTTLPSCHMTSDSVYGKVHYCFFKSGATSNFPVCYLHHIVQLPTQWISQYAIYLRHFRLYLSVSGSTLLFIRFIGRLVSTETVLTYQDKIWTSVYILVQYSRRAV